MFQRILVANRGEIALRIIRACRDLGIEVVAVFSEADRDAPYLKLVDAAVCIGPPAAADSYLNIPRIISAAEITDVQAIHPGYGFLSENPHFAEVCRSCNIEFIGPSQDAMRRLGNKKPASSPRKPACPSSPGSPGLIDPTPMRSLAQQMGYPSSSRRASGGGGCGMRRHNDISLQTGLKTARQEAEKAFKGGSVYLENTWSSLATSKCRYWADRHGNVVHLWERDCFAAATASKTGGGIARAPSSPEGAHGDLRRRPPRRKPATTALRAL